MIRRILYPLAAALALALSGCSYYCHFEARGVIRAAADGGPIQNARVEFFDSGGKPHLLASGSAAAVTTDTGGAVPSSVPDVPVGQGRTDRVDR